MHFDLMTAVEEINDAGVSQALEAGANPESWLLASNKMAFDGRLCGGSY